MTTTGPRTGFDSARDDRRDTLGGGKPRGAVNHRLAKRKPNRKRHDPFRRYSHKLGEPTPMAGAKIVAGDDDLIPGSVIRRRTFLYRAGTIDARHMWQSSDNTRMTLRRQRVLIVQRRIRDTNQDLAGRQLVDIQPYSTRSTICPSASLRATKPGTTRYCSSIPNRLLDRLRSFHFDRQLIDLRGEDEIVLREPADRVRPQFDRHVAIAFDVQIGMMAVGSASSAHRLKNLMPAMKFFTFQSLRIRCPSCVIRQPLSCFKLLLGFLGRIRLEPPSQGLHFFWTNSVGD